MRDFAIEDTALAGQGSRTRGWAVYSLAVMIAGAGIGTVLADCGDPPGRGVDWRGCNMRGADLKGANLESARLDDADLSGAVLDGANLVGASLVGAKLRNASLLGASISGANLAGAELDGATWIEGSTCMAGSDSNCLRR